MEKPTCEHCGVEKKLESGLCPECNRFPAIKRKVSDIYSYEEYREEVVKQAIKLYGDKSVCMDTIGKSYDANLDINTAADIVYQDTIGWDIA